jgi:small subunit ribosomal protein S6
MVTSSVKTSGTDEAVDTRLYECVVLYPHPFGEKEERDLLKNVEALFTDAGALLVSKDLWGRRGLAYTIGEYDEGRFVVYHWMLDPAKLKEIDRALRIEKGVLRHMIVKPPKKYQIVKYSEKYEQWLKQRGEEQHIAAQVEEEKVRERVAERAKRQLARTSERKKEKEPAAPMEKKELTQEIDKLISDDSLDL